MAVKWGILSTADINKKLLAGAADPAAGTVAEFQQYIAAENQRWSKLVKDAGITAE